MNATVIVQKLSHSARPDSNSAIEFAETSPNTLSPRVKMSRFTLLQVNDAQDETHVAENQTPRYLGAGKHEHCCLEENSDRPGQVTHRFSRLAKQHPHFSF